MPLYEVEFTTTDVPAVAQAVAGYAAALTLDATTVAMPDKPVAVTYWAPDAYTARTYGLAMYNRVAVAVTAARIRRVPNMFASRHWYDLTEEEVST